mmetsp:Transcript_20158/g.77350  ORF Transcript_20158/g.77350 Transcript_20158/m.77350 type:complete len:235 (+) Transcript_20158:226-930(+)
MRLRGVGLGGPRGLRRPALPCAGPAAAGGRRGGQRGGSGRGERFRGSARPAGRGGVPRRASRGADCGAGGRRRALGTAAAGGVAGRHVGLLGAVAGAVGGGLRHVCDRAYVPPRGVGRRALRGARCLRHPHGPRWDRGRNGHVVAALWRRHRLCHAKPLERRRGGAGARRGGRAQVHAAPAAAARVVVGAVAPSSDPDGPGPRGHLHVGADAQQRAPDGREAGPAAAAAPGGAA